MDYDKLRAELARPIYAGMSDDEVLIELRRKDAFPKYVPVEYTHVASYLSVQKKLLPIAESPLESARLFMLAVRTFSTFDLSKPEVATAVNDGLDALVSDGLILPADKAAILALAEDGTESREDQLAIGRIRKGDVEYARNIIK